MKKNKIFFLITLNTLFLVININCDERIPDAAASTNATLEITAIQSIADTDDEESVGEIVAGFSKMRIVH